MATRHAALARAQPDAPSSSSVVVEANALLRQFLENPRRSGGGGGGSGSGSSNSGSSSSSSSNNGSSAAPKRSTFPFFSLPAEIRLRVYELLLVVPHTIDLDPSNARALAPRTVPLFLASRRLHEEAYRVFYAANTFRLFPLHGRFFHTKRPLLARLPPRYRACITTLELRLGPGWSGKLPPSWNLGASDDVDSAGNAVPPKRQLGLADCAAVRRLDVFVECDPAADDIFRGFRKSDDFFTLFCAELLQRALFPRLPGVEVVSFDAFPSVKKDSPLMTELLRVARQFGKRIAFGPERGWTDEKVAELETGLAKLNLWVGRYVSA